MTLASSFCCLLYFIFIFLGKSKDCFSTSFRVLSDYNQQIYPIFLLFWIPTELLLRAASVRLAHNKRLTEALNRTERSPNTRRFGLEPHVGTLTRVGSLGKLKNLFGGRLKMPRLSLATRFGQPETTHFTMATVGTAPPEPNRTGPTGLTQHPSRDRCPLCSESTATTRGFGLFMCRFHARFRRPEEVCFWPGNTTKEGTFERSFAPNGPASFYSSDCAHNISQY